LVTRFNVLFYCGEGSRVNHLRGWSSLLKRRKDKRWRGRDGYRVHEIDLVSAGETAATTNLVPEAKEIGLGGGGGGEGEG